MTDVQISLMCGVLALLYGGWAVRSVTSAAAGSDRMREIAGAIQEGATAYLIASTSPLALSESWSR